MCSTLSIDSSRNKGSVCELNLLLVMIPRALFCNVNIRLHLKPQAVMQKYNMLINYLRLLLSDLIMFIYVVTRE